MSSTRHHILVLLVLLGFCTLVQVVSIRRAVVPGLDAVRFVEFAQAIERDGLLPTINARWEQPLYPTWVCAVHQGLTFVAGDGPSRWADSVQLAAAIPLVLCVVPLYLLILRLVGPAAAAVGGVLYCVLPEVARLGADGISDTSHLLLFAVALWAMVESLNGQGSGTRDERREAGSEELATGMPTRARAWQPAGKMQGMLLVAGVAAGLAILVRTEAALLAVTFLLMPKWEGAKKDGLSLRQPFRRIRPWRLGALARDFCRIAYDRAYTTRHFALGMALVLLPYLATVGAWTPKAAMGRLIGRPQVEEAAEQSSSQLSVADTPQDALPFGLLADGQPLAFDVKEPGHSSRRRGFAVAGTRFLHKLADIHGYWIGLFALFGAWRLRRHSQRAADRLLQTYLVLLSGVVLWFSAREGYLEARHLLTLLAVSLGAAGFGVLVTVHALAERTRTFFTRQEVQPSHDILAASHKSSAAAWLLVALIAAMYLPVVWRPLHINRRPHRTAAAWLAGQTDSTALVLDPRGWTGLYSGCPTVRYENARQTFADPRLTFVVVEKRETATDSPRSRTLRQLLATAAEAVLHLEATSPLDPGGAVTVYRWHLLSPLSRVGRGAGGEGGIADTIADKLSMTLQTSDFPGSQTPAWEPGGITLVANPSPLVRSERKRESSFSH